MHLQADKHPYEEDGEEDEEEEVEDKEKEVKEDEDEEMDEDEDEDEAVGPWGAIIFQARQLWPCFGANLPQKGSSIAANAAASKVCPF